MFEDAMITDFSQEEICENFAKSCDKERSALPSLACGASDPAARFGSPRTAPLPRRPRLKTRTWFALFCLVFCSHLQAQIDDATRQLSHDIFKQLIEINTTDSV